MYKISLTLLLIGLSLFSSLNLNAQFGPVQTTMRTPHGNIHVTNYIHSPIYYGGKGIATGEHSFNIVFLDSTEKIVRGSICVDSPSYYIKWVDKSVGRKDSGRIKKIYPSQTLHIVRNDENTNTLYGINADSCWLFKSIKGRINVYTSLAEDEITDELILYIQKEDSPLLQMNDTNFGDMVKDNEKAYRFFKKKKYLKAINIYNNF